MTYILKLTELEMEVLCKHFYKLRGQYRDCMVGRTRGRALAHQVVSRRAMRMHHSIMNKFQAWHLAMPEPDVGEFELADIIQIVNSWQALHDEHNINVCVMAPPQGQNEAHEVLVLMEEMYAIMTVMMKIRGVFIENVTTLD